MGFLLRVTCVFSLVAFKTLYLILTMHWFGILLPCLAYNLKVWFRLWCPIFSICSVSVLLKYFHIPYLFDLHPYVVSVTQSSIFCLIHSTCKFFSVFLLHYRLFFHFISISAWVLFNVSISLYWITLSNPACFLMSISIVFVIGHRSSIYLYSKVFSPCFLRTPWILWWSLYLFF